MDYRKKKLCENIRLILFRKKMYQVRTYSIDRLAIDLGIDAHVISDTIRECYNKSYEEFVDGYRIQEAKTLMKDKRFQDVTSVEMSFMVGFKTTASYEKAFRKMEHMAPGDYLRKIRQNRQIAHATLAHKVA